MPPNHHVFALPATSPEQQGPSGGGTSSTGPAAPVAAKPAPRRLSPAEQQREFTESFVVAFLAAFLFRTFVAEAFIIPTGSMAPTLLGRNKDVVCPGCQFSYTFGSSPELNDQTGALERRVVRAQCPNCNLRSRVKDLPVFRGDRIVVNKFPYEFADPERWDVVVFRFPNDPQRNYIKRCVGLPGESLLISRGDVYSRTRVDQPYRICRKEDPDKQRLLQQTVYDDRYPPRPLIEAGWPERWGAFQSPDPTERAREFVPDESGWAADRNARTYSIKAQADWRWLRYQHWLPAMSNWQLASNGGKLNPQSLKPQIITDFCSYNSFETAAVREDKDKLERFERGDDEDLGSLWMGDLSLRATVEITEAPTPDSVLVLELVEGLRHYQCTIRPATGDATLSYNDELAEQATPIVLAKAQTPFQGTGRHTLEFANVDQRLCLWVDGRLVKFDRSTEYQDPQLLGPRTDDLFPVGIAARGLAATVSQLIVLRDVYYRAQSDLVTYEIPRSEWGYSEGARSDPDRWREHYERIRVSAEFPNLASDEFFMLGDNSPSSLDSRLWHNQRNPERPYAVPRNALVGQAFFRFWPHGVPFLNDGRGYAPLENTWFYHVDSERELVLDYPHTTIPFRPQFDKMTPIR